MPSTFFSKQYVWTKTIKKVKTEQCPTGYILDLNRGNIKVKTMIKGKPYSKITYKTSLWKGKTKSLAKWQKISQDVTYRQILEIFNESVSWH